MFATLVLAFAADPVERWLYPEPRQLAALAGDRESPVPAFEAQVLDVGSSGLRHSGGPVRSRGAQVRGPIHAGAHHHAVPAGAHTLGANSRHARCRAAAPLDGDVTPMRSPGRSAGNRTGIPTILPAPGQRLQPPAPARGRARNTSGLPQEASQVLGLFTRAAIPGWQGQSQLWNWYMYQPGLSAGAAMNTAWPCPDLCSLAGKSCRK